MDPDLSRLIYKSDRATYTTDDSSNYKFPPFDPETTVVFFDDHQNALERLRQAHGGGFRHLIFEDNYYPVGVSDCYSLKLLLAGEGWRPERTFRNAIKGLLGQRPKSAAPNEQDGVEFRSLVEVYEEQPPVYLPEPLLTERRESLAAFWDEAASYTWMAYVRLKAQQ